MLSRALKEHTLKQAATKEKQGTSSSSLLFMFKMITETEMLDVCVSYIMQYNVQWRRNIVQCCQICHSQYETETLLTHVCMLCIPVSL